MKQNELFPKIRFKEFTNAWEQWKVGDLIIERIEFTKESDEFPLMAFVANEGIAAKGERYDRSSLVKDIDNKIYKITKYGDFIYSSNNLDRGSIGANKYGNACISPVYSIFKCTNYSDHNFIENILSKHSFINKLLEYRQGVVYGQLKIHESIFLNIKLNSPSILEQNKIGKIFSNLDSLITLHQRKLILLKNTKNRLLEKMFCDEKSQFPSIRFKEFTNAWEQEKLGNLTILNRFPQISANQLKKINEYKGDIYLLPSSNNNDWKCRYNEKISHLINNAEIITVGRARNPNPKYVNGRFISSQNHIIESKMNDILTNKFLYFFICKVGRTFYSAASTYPMFTRVDFGDARLLFPLINEQHKILKTFNSLDSLITLHQRKLELLKSIKNILLEKMFV
ncbi:restriction endonuclease subunit S [Mycoplasma capricolum subsp. capricolum]|uniref:restriction endonuclease subunit S n=1 Tax=Mycoplasma capricolum TaxID=2095 RepID=UPI003DA1F14E